MMSIISWLIFGLIAGAIAKAIRPGADPGGWIASIIIGILGAFLGGWLFSQFGSAPIENWSFKGFVAAIVGAIILLWLYSLITRRRA